MTTYWTTMDSPIGTLRLTSDDIGLTGVFMQEHRHGPVDVGADWVRDDDLHAEPRRQIEAYFSRDLFEFDLPLHAIGTPFQQEVWTALRTIPYGEVRSYRDIAEQIGRPKAVRAVGLANGRNPLSIIVPCHRVIGASGSLTGYGGGIERKRALLELEAMTSGLYQLQP
jgi:methylated-DNA-[protein]-cysteine S-methyltransferase